MSSADELLVRFTEPGREFSPLPIWWWSGAKVTGERLRWQMEQLVSQGIHQAVVMCLAPAGPLFGSLADDPPFLSPAWCALADQACEDAEELGFTLWMYDQIGFSGANFQGRVIAENPDFAGQALYRDGETVHFRTSGFDYFSEKACAALLDQVHGRLERALGHRFGRGIGGFFQDELPPLPTWGPDFAETFAEEYGYDLVPELRVLWEGTGDDAARVRRDYHAHRARLARRGFFDQHDAWFARHGLVCGFDQASPAREGDPVGGVRIYGDYLGTHSGYGAPGSDHWGDAKVHSSLAHAYGHWRTWIEAFHSSGWGGTLEETYDWLAPFLRRGATLYDPHAVYYSTQGGWWEWAPPSTCWRQPYWPSYHVFANAVSRLCSVLTAGTHVCDTVLLSPTTNSQAYLTLDGALEPAERAAAVFHELNGVNTWFDERPGVLERAGIDHDVLDEKTLASTEIHGDTLRLGSETYRTVVLPEVRMLDSAVARHLRAFADAGGRVVCVGSAPVPGILVADNASQVPELVRFGPVRVHADVPFLLRRHGDTYVLMLAVRGTESPIVSLPPMDWTQEGFPWDEYWAQLREKGYRFSPPGVAHVRVDGLTGFRAQRWDPGTGERTELDVTDAGFTVEGPVALVVLGEDLPPASRKPLGPVLERRPVGPWRAVAKSTLDNRWGDLAAADRGGVLPIEVWRFEHSVDGERWEPVVASFGTFAEIRDPDGSWRPAEWSLSRGVRDDPIHLETLGPKGYVPEEFLDWRSVGAGETVAVRTHLDLSGPYLVVGSNAARRVFVDGTELPVEGEGYYSVTPLRTQGKLEIEFRAETTGPVRASFAVVSDLDAYRRPEWLSSAELTRRFEPVPGGTTVQVASDGPCALLVNGIEIGRQGDFNPYPGHREIRVHPYDLTPHLRDGENVLTLRLTDVDERPTAVAVDSNSPDLVTGTGWAGKPAKSLRDPRFLCLRARPHPLPGAHWLEPDAAGVLPVVPNAFGDGERTEWLRFPAPLGTTALRIPTSLDVRVHVDGREYPDFSFDAPLPAGTPVVLEFRAVDGRRGGALLDSAVEVEVAETGTTLDSWEDLGLRSLGGEVRYRATVDHIGGRTVLDLGEVRGTAEVIVNGHTAQHLVWGPWRSEIALRQGKNEIEVVVRGTLAGYLDDASPTMAVAAGQVRTGLFGPVTIVRHAEETR